jgi:hypothetical protein
MQAGPEEALLFFRPEDDALFWGRWFLQCIPLDNITFFFIKSPHATASSPGFSGRPSPYYGAGNKPVRYI